MPERWCSVDEIAAHLGVARETVYRWIDHRRLPAHRLGKFWKLKVSEVDAWAVAGEAALDLHVVESHLPGGSQIPTADTRTVGRPGAPNDA